MGLIKLAWIYYMYKFLEIPSINGKISTKIEKPQFEKKDTP